MKRFRFGKREFLCDVEATRRVYGAIETGAPERCGCTECKNFATARDEGRICSDDFVAFLTRLGINPRYEAEVYWQGPVAPGEHLYGGWYHFVGSLHAEARAGQPVAEDFSDLDVEHLDRNCAILFGAGATLVNSAFGGLPVVQLEFEARVPWVVESPEPK